MCIGMCMSITPPIPPLVPRGPCTMYHLDTTLDTAPSTISVDHVDLCGMYNLVSDN